MAKSVPAIILAAGASKRLGQPKALVKWDGESLVSRAARLLFESKCNPVIVVTRTELQIDVVLEAENASVIVNPNPELGRTGSLQLGLKSLISELGRTPRKVLVAPVDRCGWDNETISSLIECDKNTSPIPSGHPLLLTDIDVVLGLSKDASLEGQYRNSKNSSIRKTHEYRYSSRFGGLAMTARVMRWALSELEKNSKVAIASVVSTSGSVPGKVGARLAISETGINGTIGGAGLEMIVSKSLNDMLIDATKPIGKVEVFGLNKGAKGYEVRPLDSLCGGVLPSQWRF